LAPDVDIQALDRRIPVNTYSQDWGKMGWGGWINIGRKQILDTQHNVYVEQVKINIIRFCLNIILLKK